MPDAITKPVSSRLGIGPCALGQGLFARQHFRPAETILDLTGPAVPADRARHSEQSFNLLQVGPHTYLELEEPGVFINHSCEPNVGVVDDTVLIALRDIAPGEEIRFDYSTTMSEQFETMQCRCGTASCRGVVGDFHDLSAAVKDRYLAARLVQVFIVHEHRERQQRARPLRIEPAKVIRMTRESAAPSPIDCAA